MLNPKKKPTTVTEYIQQAPQPAQKKLREMRSILKSVSPEAVEGIKWSTPAFSYERILYTYAGFKNHIGFYPTPAALKAFEKELSRFETGKGSVKFPIDKPLPKGLIQKIAKFRIRDLKESDAKWM